jgi:hypothetical protein
MPGTVVATGTPRWRKFSVTEADFTAAATSEDIELFSLDAGEIIHAVKIKHSTAFSGGSATSFTLSVGIAGNLTKYASAFDVFQAVADTTFQLSNTFNSENHGSATSIRIEAVSDVNVANLTAGAADVWVLVSKAT